MAELPIIYLRGYAGNQGGVETTVDDPFYGFNQGSTHVRSGERGEAYFFGFEGPVIRLLGDHGYHDVYERGVQGRVPGGQRRFPPASLWIYRYYDVTSRTFEGSPGRRLEIEQAAEGLRQLIEEVKDATGAERVLLVGHSTGGLIIRSLLQRTYPAAGVNPTDHVAKVFTYGTPHGGIHFDVIGGSLLEWARDQLGANNMDDFGPDRMYQYLTPGVRTGSRAPRDFEPRRLTGGFPEERFFCLVGTNAGDYGLPKHVVGARSDGLVQIGSAYVKGAPRAYVHRSHSGRYGLVNSEEGYQNLRRFFFGDMRVDLALDNLDRVEEAATDPAVFHLADAQVALRGLPILMHDQTVEHNSAVLLDFERHTEGEPVALFTMYLIPALSSEADQTCRYGLRLSLQRFHRREGFLMFRDHLERMPLWTDHLVVDLSRTDDGYAGRYTWRSEGADPDRPLELLPGDGGWQVHVPLPRQGRSVLGADAEILMRARSWG